LYDYALRWQDHDTVCCQKQWMWLAWCVCVASTMCLGLTLCARNNLCGLEPLNDLSVPLAKPWPECFMWSNLWACIADSMLLFLSTYICPGYWTCENGHILLSQREYIYIYIVFLLRNIYCIADSMLGKERDGRRGQEGLFPFTCPAG
jgi:hypothetical protein